MGKSVVTVFVMAIVTLTDSLELLFIKIKTKALAFTPVPVLKKSNYTCTESKYQHVRGMLFPEPTHNPLHVIGMHMKNPSLNLHEIG